MRRPAAVAGLALAAAVLLPGCVTGAEVIVVVGHDDTGAAVAGAVACDGPRDAAIESLTVTGRETGEVRDLDRDVGGASIDRVRLAPVPADLGATVVVSATQYEEIPEDALRATLARDGTPGHFRVITDDDATGPLDAAGASGEVEQLCRDHGRWGSGALPRGVLIAVGAGVVGITLAALAWGVLLGAREVRRR